MTNRYQGSEDEGQALNAYVKLMRASESVTSRLSPLLEKAGLTTSQFGALEALLHLGPMCQRDLARKLLKSGGNITLVVDNLEKRDLVRRERGRDDRRFITVHLTEEGRRLIREIFPRHATALTEVMRALSEDELAELGRLCKKLGLHAAG